MENSKENNITGWKNMESAKRNIEVHGLLASFKSSKVPMYTPNKSLCIHER